MARVKVGKSVLRWAVDRSGKPIAELESRFVGLDEWLDGSVMPTLRQLEDFARATSTPLGFLLLDKPPRDDLSIPFFRTISEKSPSRASANLIDTLQIMQRRQAWMRDFMVDEGYEPLQFVASATLKQNPAVAVEKMRETLSLGTDWAASYSTWEDALRALREAMDSIGIVVVVNGVVGNNTHRPLDVGEFRGFVLVDPFAPLVFINGTDAKAAQMFTLAHELAHVFFGSSAAFDLRQMMPANDATEIACNLLISV